MNVTKSVLMLALAAGLYAIPGSAQAVCSNAVTASSLVKNGPAKHVTVVDQSCNIVPPSQITLITGGLGQCTTAAVGLATNIPAPNRVSITPDATGFNFQAIPAAPAMSVCSVSFSFADGTVTRLVSLSVDVPSDVTSITLTSP